MFTLRSLAMAHDWVSHVTGLGETVIDATVGNGHDTYFLAKLVGTAGRVYGFDIQSEAVSKATCLLNCKQKDDGIDYNKYVTLFAECHSRIGVHCNEQVAAVMFNLGYLPSSDKTVITKEDTTLKALQFSLKLLKPNGIITIVCYPGHEGGEDESLAVEAWTKALPTPEYSVLKAVPHNPRSRAPYLIGIQKGRR